MISVQGVAQTVVLKIRFTWQTAIPPPLIKYTIVRKFLKIVDNLDLIITIICCLIVLSSTIYWVIDYVHQYPKNNEVYAQNSNNDSMYLSDDSYDVYSKKEEVKEIVPQQKNNSGNRSVSKSKISVDNNSIPPSKIDNKNNSKSSCVGQKQPPKVNDSPKPTCEEKKLAKKEQVGVVNNDTSVPDL